MFGKFIDDLSAKREPKKWTICVNQNVPTHELDHEDREFDPSGIYTIKAETEDKALDEFHATVPISCLDHYLIDIEEEN